MRIGQVLAVSGEIATVFIDEVEIRVKCQIVKNVTVVSNDIVLVELFPGGVNGVIIGVM